MKIQNYILGMLLALRHERKTQIPTNRMSKHPNHEKKKRELSKQEKRQREKNRHLSRKKRK